MDKNRAEITVDEGDHTAAKRAAQLASFEASWRFSRALSLDLLAALSENSLLFSPGDKLGPFWKQFRHLGRVQENYMTALDTGVVKFSPESAGYTPEKTAGGADKKALRQYLQDLDARLFERLHREPLPETIDWFGEPVGLVEHLFRLDSHETLHHGQWIVYCQLCRQPFPDSWSIWGLTS
jgi:uncharacterized damage-inducible protein DinB